MARRRRRPHEEDERHEGPWNEEKWERFMEESDVRSAKFGELFETFRNHPERDSIISKEMGWDRDEDDEEPEEDRHQWTEIMKEAEAAADDDEIKEVMRREEEELENMPAYRQSFDYGLMVHDALEQYIESKEEPDEDFLEAFSNSMIIAAKIAGGHGMGYDDDVLCGNIVCLKRSLAAADKCLEALESLKARGLAPAKTLDPLIKDGREVRALVEQRIAELRARVWWS